MGKVSRGIGARDIREGEYVQARLTTPACRVDRKEYGPSYKSTHKCHQREHFKESDVEVCVEGVMVEDVVIAQALELAEPAQDACPCGRRLFAV